MQPSKESHAFLQKLLQSPPQLPFEPLLLPMLFAVTRDGSIASTDDLVALIERSQKLASRILTIANSAAYGLEYKVASLHRAISILGIREIRTLTLMVGTASLINGAKLPKDFAITPLWKHQLRTAAVARALSAELAKHPGACGPAAKDEDRLSMAPDEAYVAGLLHDIGKIFFAISRPDLWEAVEELWRRSGQAYFEAENTYWGMDHALIGAEVLHHWQLPLLLTEPINWHHAPELAPVYKMESRLLAAADHIVHSGLDSEGGLCVEAARLLPAEIDFAALGNAVAQSLAAADEDTLMTLIN